MPRHGDSGAVGNVVPVPVVSGVVVLIDEFTVTTSGVINLGTLLSRDASQGGDIGVGHGGRVYRA